MHVGCGSRVVSVNVSSHILLIISFQIQLKIYNSYIQSPLEVKLMGGQRLVLDILELI